MTLQTGVASGFCLNGTNVLQHHLLLISSSGSKWHYPEELPTFERLATLCAELRSQAV